MEGPGGRDGLLDIFDKLGIVMHFANLPFLTDYVLNPRWLTYGVYTIMYSEEAKAAKGTAKRSRPCRNFEKGESLDLERPIVHAIRRIAAALSPTP